MGKTRDKNNLGSSLTNSKKPPKPTTRSQRAKISAAKALGHSSVTDQSNLNEVIDKLDYVSMMSSSRPDYATRANNDVIAEDECSDDYEDCSSGEEEVEEGSEYEEDGSMANVEPDDGVCLVLRDPNMEGPISKMERELAQKESEDKRKFLVIPRRPKWTSDTKADKLSLMESQSFAEWKYRISQTVQMLKHCTTTPFERNLDFWRQLWRVVERSDIVVQIVDARNPLLFFTEDLYSYCHEFDHPKTFFLLINKADFLSSELRQKWANYFTKRNLEFKFFCALSDTESNTEASSYDTSSSIFSGKQLIDFIKSVQLDHQLNSAYRTCGFIGYPNVGKSSTINHLVGASKTSTSATPGKTKHFQTLFIDANLCLCDCPGLVMPNFVNSKSELLTNGILPIDQATEFVTPIEIIGQQLGWDKMCSHYGFSTEQLLRHNAEGFLSQFALSRGFGTARGNPDVSKSAKFVLKDFVNGKLIYCHPPPDNENSSSSKTESESTANNGEAVLTAMLFKTEPTDRKRNEALEARIDSQFFASSGGNVHTKSRSDMYGRDGNEKSSKKHHKGNKKEKLRRVYKDLDAY